MVGRKSKIGELCNPETLTIFENKKKLSFGINVGIKSRDRNHL